MELEEATRPYWDVNEGDPENAKLPFPTIADYFFVARGQMVFMGLRAMDETRAGQLVGLVYQLTGQVPGTITRASQTSLFSRELGVGRSVDIEITGPDLNRLVEMGREIFSEVPQVVPGAMAFPIPSLDLSSPEVHIQRRTERAADMGISTEELGYTVNALVDGAYATDFYLGGDKIDLTIMGNQRFAERTQDLAGLTIATGAGDLVRLEALADIELTGGPEQINHRERQRAITVSVTPPAEVPLEAAIAAIDEKIVRPRLESGAIGEEYRIDLAGTADKLAATWRALRWNFLLAILVTYLLMAALFESWLYPFVIILSVPLGAVGGILGLWLLNLYLGLFPYGSPQTLDVLTMLGFVILIGTVVNNPILIVHQSLNHMRDEGMSPNQAILASVRTRIRPIFMTTSTTVLGLSPLVLSPGAGSELYRGLGAVVLGGLLVSTLFTLILVPALFSLMMEAKAALARALGLQPPSPPAPLERERQQPVAAG
jgi:HAE1 family hydrophobic/amphiphilic exporter-1